MYQYLSEVEKTKSINMLVGDLEIFLKKKKLRSVNMVINAMQILQKMKSYSRMQKIKYHAKMKTN